MLLPFIGGLMNPVWMAAVMLLALAERIFPNGDRVAKAQRRPPYWHRPPLVLFAKSQETEMNGRSKPPQTLRGTRFDPAAFLTASAKGRLISKHQKRQIIFAQGDTADAVMYIRKG
jgi:hypothetical protein